MEANILFTAVDDFLCTMVDNLEELVLIGS